MFYMFLPQTVENLENIHLFMKGFLNFPYFFF